CFQYYSGYTF
nr:immunoglobulin light chain junction region [Macaca mulatta]MOV65510.1 immunoglobulin light chain junction region [Macaca mulatta]MOX48724.1 immunoglobulin light chain junction region [Macaca mulatta]